WLLAFRQFGLPKWKHDFEFRTFDHSDNSPDWICIVYYNKIPAARQFEICAPPGFFRFLL
ncbi:hypothetical protein, partial [Fournierella sp.]|uniref:hypothetical protein n=1 Tax=Allofournierella sp. TaxID=1940256 RepID=UPI00307B0CBF